MGSSGNLETKLFRKVTVRYTDTDVLDIYLKLQTVIQALTPGIVSPNCPAVVLQYQEWCSVVYIAIQTVSALPSHSFRMTKLVRWKNWLGTLIARSSIESYFYFTGWRLYSREYDCVKRKQPINRHLCGRRTDWYLSVFPWLVIFSKHWSLLQTLSRIKNLGQCQELLPHSFSDQWRPCLYPWPGYQWVPDNTVYWQILHWSKWC